MPAGGFKTFVAGEILTSADTNDFLMQGVLVFADATARDAAITSPVEGQFVFRTDDDVLEFYDGTEFVEVSGEPGSAVISATTGSPTETTIVDGGVTFDVFQFTGDGTITVAEAGLVEFLVIAGGGGGGSGLLVTDRQGGGGGGAGGYRSNVPGEDTGSGLDAEQQLLVAAGTYTVTVGAGGAGATGENLAGQPGNLSSAFGVFAHIGGRGERSRAASGFGASSGGPGAEASPLTGPFGVESQGSKGGNSAINAGGGGGGASAAGGNASTDNGGVGGAGISSVITGTGVGRAGGGGGGARVSGGSASDGGGAGITTGGPNAGAVNTGGGGGGSRSVEGGAGGSGIVIVRVAV